MTPTTQRLLQHWRHYNFQNQRPFFCQVEAVETAIWLHEVARGKKQYAHIFRTLETANEEANPHPLFEPEYADILGIPFDFASEPVKVIKKPPKPVTRVHAVRERAALAIRISPAWRATGWSCPRIVWKPGSGRNTA